MDHENYGNLWDICHQQYGSGYRLIDAMLFWELKIV